MGQAAVRWNIKVSKETDLALRTHLGAQGMKKGDLSKFIEEAVNWRLFNQSVRRIKAANHRFSPEELQRIIDQAVGQVRAERRARSKSRND